MIRISSELLKDRIVRNLYAAEAVVEPAAPSNLELDLEAIPDDEEFLVEAFQRILGRMPELDGFVHFSNVLNTHSRGFVLDTLRRTILESGSVVELGDLLAIESNVEFVRAVYYHMFCRAGDPAGIASWQQHLNAGLPRPELLLEFSRCEEAAQRKYTLHGVPLANAVPAPLNSGAEPTSPEPVEPPLELAGLCIIEDDAAFVDASYQAILGRTADPAGFAFYLDALRQGACREEILVRMADTSEAKARTRKLTLNATPMDELRVVEKPVVATSAPPVELGDLLAIERNTDFVRAAYSRMFVRDGDPAGMAYWQKSLEMGMSRPELLLEFSFCEEAAGQKYAIHGVPLANAVPAIADSGAEPSSLDPLEPPLELAGLGVIEDDAAFLHAAYQAIVEREADPAGVEFFLEALRKGASREEILVRMAGTPEAEARTRKLTLIGTPVDLLLASFGAPAEKPAAAPSTPPVELRDLMAIEPNAEFVRAVYSLMFGRDGEPEGMSYWQQSLDAGTPRLKLLLEFSRCEEAAATVYVLYGIPLAVVAETLAGRVASAPAPLSPIPVAKPGLLSSFPSPSKKEHKPDEAYGDPTVDLAGLDRIHEPGQFVYEAYRNILGRKPEFEGFEHYRNLLHLGVSRPQLLAQLAGSAEASKRNLKFTGGLLPSASIPSFLVRVRMRIRPLLDWNSDRALEYGLCLMRDELRENEIRRREDLGRERQRQSAEVERFSENVSANMLSLHNQQTDLATRQNTALAENQKLLAASLAQQEQLAEFTRAWLAKFFQPLSLAVAETLNVQQKQGGRLAVLSAAMQALSETARKIALALQRLEHTQQAAVASGEAAADRRAASVNSGLAQRLEEVVVKAAELSSAVPSLTVAVAEIRNAQQNQDGKLAALSTAMQTFSETVREITMTLQKFENMQRAAVTFSEGADRRAASVTSALSQLMEGAAVKAAELSTMLGAGFSECRTSFQNIDRQLVDSTTEFLAANVAGRNIVTAGFDGVNRNLTSLFGRSSDQQGMMLRQIESTAAQTRVAHENTVAWLELQKTRWEHFTAQFDFKHANLSDQIAAGTRHAQGSFDAMFSKLDTHGLNVQAHQDGFRTRFDDMQALLHDRFQQQSTYYRNLLSVVEDQEVKLTRGTGALLEELGAVANNVQTRQNDVQRGLEVFRTGLARAEEQVVGAAVAAERFRAETQSNAGFVLQKLDSLARDVAARQETIQQSLAQAARRADVAEVQAQLTTGFAAVGAVRDTQQQTAESFYQKLDAMAGDSRIREEGIQRGIDQAGGVLNSLARDVAAREEAIQQSLAQAARRADVAGVQEQLTTGFAAVEAVRDRQQQTAESLYRKLDAMAGESQTREEGIQRGIDQAGGVLDSLARDVAAREEAMQQSLAQTARSGDVAEVQEQLTTGFTVVGAVRDTQQQTAESLYQKLDAMAGDSQIREEGIQRGIDQAGGVLDSLARNVGAEEAMQQILVQAARRADVAEVQDQLTTGFAAVGAARDERLRTEGLLFLKLDALAGDSQIRQEAIQGNLATVLHHVRPQVLSCPGVLVTNVDDFVLSIPQEEWRTAAFYAFWGTLERGLTLLFRKIVREGMVVVDVGANLGIYTLHAARIVGPTGKVYSFEPTPRTFDILKQNVITNAFEDRVELSPLAVLNKKTRLPLYVQTGQCGWNTLFRYEGKESEPVMVQSIRLDDALSAAVRIDIVKIDAEGAEPFILQGMKRLLNKNPQAILLVEFAPSHLVRAGVNPADFLGQLAHIFTIHQVDDISGELLPFDRETLLASLSTNLHLQKKEKA